MNRIMQHHIKFNGSYCSLEELAKMVNRTPNASIQVPSTKYKIKKSIDPIFSSEKYSKCMKCRNYVGSLSEAKCCSSTQLDNSEYFVYIGIEQQLVLSIKQNIKDILNHYYKVLDSGNIIDIHNSVAFKNALKQYNSCILLPLIINTDGVKNFKHSKNSLWLIQIYQGFLPPSVRLKPQNVLLIAAHFGEKKLPMNDFFYPFLRDLYQIQENGGIILNINGENMKFMPFLLSCCSDLPATADVIQMNGHNGKFACIKCMHPGTSIKSQAMNSKKSITRIRYVNADHGLRTHESFINIYSKIKPGQILNGIKGISCLVAAKHFDLSCSIAIDHMHCCELGLMKKLLSLWLDSKNHSEPYYITKKNQVLLSSRIVNIKPISNISRKPKSIFGDMKANEYRSLMLYFIRFALPGCIHSKYITHFHLFCSAMYMLLKEQISESMIEEAERRLNQFADEYEILYGQKNVTFNLHLLRHLASNVRYLGPLWSQSAYAFEASNGIISKSNTSKKDVVHQISWNYIMRHTFKMTKPNIKFSVGKLKLIRLCPEDIEFLAMNGVQSNNKFMNIYTDLVMNGIQYKSLKSNEVSTIDYFIKTRNGLIGTITYFVYIHEIMYARIEMYDISCTFDHFIEITKNGRAKLLNINQIDKKMMYLKFGIREFVTSLANMYEKS